jgi:hypothetical protein
MSQIRVCLGLAHPSTHDHVLAIIIKLAHWKIRMRSERQGRQWRHPILQTLQHLVQLEQEFLNVDFKIACYIGKAT